MNLDFSGCFDSVADSVADSSGECFADSAALHCLSDNVTDHQPNFAENWIDLALRFVDTAGGLFGLVES